MIPFNRMFNLLEEFKTSMIANKNIVIWPTLNSNASLKGPTLLLGKVFLCFFHV